MPFAPTTSSVLPSAEVAEERIDWLIVSPVASDAVMITVASINPTTISAARPRRRLTFRTPSRKKTRLRDASTRPRPEQQQQDDHERHCERADRDPEQLAHAITQRVSAGASATTTS